MSYIEELKQCRKDYPLNPLENYIVDKDGASGILAKIEVLWDKQYRELERFVTEDVKKIKEAITAAQMKQPCLKHYYDNAILNHRFGFELWDESVLHRHSDEDGSVWFEIQEMNNSNFILKRCQDEDSEDAIIHYEIRDKSNSLPAIQQIYSEINTIQNLKYKNKFPSLYLSSFIFTEYLRRIKLALNSYYPNFKMDIKYPYVQIIYSLAQELMKQQKRNVERQKIDPEYPASPKLKIDFEQITKDMKDAFGDILKVPFNEYYNE